MENWTKPSNETHEHHELLVFIGIRTLAAPATNMPTNVGSSDRTAIHPGDPKTSQNNKIQTLIQTRPLKEGPSRARIQNFDRIQTPRPVDKKGPAPKGPPAKSGATLTGQKRRRNPIEILDGMHSGNKKQNNPNPKSVHVPMYLASSQK